MFAFLPQMYDLIRSHTVVCLARYREVRRAAQEAHHRLALYKRPRLEDLEERLLLDAYGFQNPTTGAPNSGSWMVVSNWTDFNSIGGIATRLPGGGDTVDIPSGAICVLPSGTSDQAIAGLTVEGSLTIGSKLSSVGVASASGSIFNVPGGGELDVTGTATFGGSGAIGGILETPTSITFGPTSTMALVPGVALTGTFLINGPLADSANMTTSASLTLDAGGAFSGASLTGTGSIDDFGDFNFDGGTLGLAGGMDLEGSSDFKMDSAAGKTLSAGTITNNSLATDLGGSGGFTIDTSAGFSVATGTVTLAVPFVSEGLGAKGGAGPAGIFTVGSGTLDVNGTGDTLINCDFTNSSGGRLSVDKSATLTLSTSAGALPASTITLDGTLMLDGDLYLDGPIGSPSGFDEFNGTMIVGDASVTSHGSSLTIGTDSEIGGTVEVTSLSMLTGGGTLHNSGDLKLDVGSTTAGLGAYVQANFGTLEIETGSPRMPGMVPPYSPLTVTGNAQLSGTLKFDFPSGYTPPHGMNFTVVKAGSIGAHFDQVPTNMTANYTSTSASVTEN